MNQDFQEMKSPTELLDFVWKLYANLGKDVGLHWRDLFTLRNRLYSEGLPFVTVTLPKLSKLMLAGLGTGSFSTPSSFKRRGPGDALPAFLGSLFSRVFTPSGHLMENADPEAVLKIRQLCEFAYKADFPRKEEKDLAVIEGFVSTEAELSEVKIDPDPILLVGRAILADVFSSYDRNDLRFRHGPGVTANVPIVEKFDHRLTYGLQSVASFGSSFFFNEEDALTRLDRYPVAANDSYFKPSSIAKVILVPKDSRGPRLISCEPAENQWVQQGIARFMINALEGHRFSGGQVNFTDQGINRALALESSVTLKYATLDLKDASDRVTLELVRNLFGGQLLSDLLDVRSTHTTLPDGRVLALAKYAPMGSALCFPVMASCIYALCVSAIFGLTGDLESAAKSVFVYGDDIIVENEYASFVINVLERYKLKVNREKSFIDSPFVESCGMDAFKGVDVTPIRLRDADIRCKQSLLKEKPSVLLSLVSTGNLLSIRNHSSASEFLLKFSERWFGPLPYGHLNSPYICRLTQQTPFIAEMNYMRKGIRWFPRRNRQRHPLGAVMQAFQVVPEKCQAEGSVYGHFMRIWSQLGSGEPLPRMGEYTLPRQFVLRRSTFDHYSMDPCPAASWLP